MLEPLYVKCKTYSAQLHQKLCIVKYIQAYRSEEIGETDKLEEIGIPPRGTFVNCTVVQHKTIICKFRHSDTEIRYSAKFGSY